MHTLSLSLVRPPPSSLKEDALSLEEEDPQFTTQTIHTIRTTKDPNEQQTFEHLAHSGAPVTLGPSGQGPIGPLAPPVFLPYVCNPTANFEHWTQE